MNAEQYIKSKLDGSFFSLHSARTGDAAPRLVKLRVPKDFIPRFESMAMIEKCQEAGRNNGVKVRSWTVEEDNHLLALRAANVRWEAIAGELRRGKKGLAERYKALCEERGITPMRIAHRGPASITADERAQIVALRDSGLTFQQITEQMGLKAYIARDYYNRFKQQLKQRREAA